MDLSSLSIVLLGVGAMLTLSTGIILFVVLYQRRVVAHKHELTIMQLQKEKELSEATILAEEEERSRIAAELHDDVGAMLSSVRLYLRNANKEGVVNDAVSRSQELLDESISKVRNISHRLQPAMLHHLGLQKALQSFFEMFSKTGSITIEYTGGELPSLNDNTSLAVYRIVQELVNNMTKYAGATIAEVYCDVAGNVLHLRLSHDGQGISEEQFAEYLEKKNASGLKNIVTRLNVLNGIIEFKMSNNQYHTIISIPV
jgi:signal transduction histidine kinase